MTAWLVLFTAVSIYLYQDGREAKRALCELRANRERGLQRTVDYLQNHPKGVPGFVTVAELNTSIRDQRQTVDALSELDC